MQRYGKKSNFQIFFDFFCNFFCVPIYKCKKFPVFGDFSRAGLVFVVWFIYRDMAKKQLSKYPGLLLLSFVCRYFVAGIDSRDDLGRTGPGRSGDDLGRDDLSPADDLGRDGPGRSGREGQGRGFDR